VKVKDTIEEEQKKILKEHREALKGAKLVEKAAEQEYRKASNTFGATSTQAELLHKALTATKLEVLKQQNAVSNSSLEWQPEPEWHRKALFLKIIRGDVGDGIFSANPGVRYKSSKKSVGIEDAWKDRNNRGFEWNNFMLKRWNKLVGDDTVEVRVIDEFEKNETLIDLTKQPQEIKDLMDGVIVEAVQKPDVQHVGMNFARFCKKHELNRLSVEAQEFAKILGARYHD
jgi:hypothetical protein